MLLQAAAAGFLMSLIAAGAAPPPDGSPPATRIAQAEAELCLPRCPPIPAQPSSDWLRSEEGRRANACALSCRVDPPAATLFRRMVELATSRDLDPAAPSATSLGKGAPELLHRLRQATVESQGKRLGGLCAKARGGASHSAELAYLDCTGRVALTRGADPSPPPDPLKALGCAVTFAESEASWLTRCPALERRALADIESCSVEAEAQAGARAQCEREAVAALARAMRRRAPR